MHSTAGFSSISARAFAVALAATALLSAPVSADTVKWLDGHYIYSDAYGNLVAVRPGGYKKIIVGQGHLADSYQPETAVLPRTGEQAGEPTVLYSRDHNGMERQYKFLQKVDASECIGGAVVIRGRSFMYGIERNVTPVIGPVC